LLLSPAACTFAAFEKASLRRIAGNANGCAEVLSCFDMAFAAKLQFTHGSMVKGISCEPLAVGNGCNFCQRDLSIEEERFSSDVGYPDVQ
jgi:hypothetical protein